MRSAHRLLLALTLAGLAASCASTRGDRDREIAEADLGQIPTGEVTTWREMSVGEYLAQLDGRMDRWFRLKTRADADAARVRDVLEIEIQRYVGVRRDELIHELAQGPPRNRTIAAAALGFSDDSEALGPLLAAIDDSDPVVRQQAVLGLGLLADPDTPVEKVIEVLRSAPEDVARTNAAYTLFRLVRQGVDGEPLLDDLRRALLDPAPGVRAQAAATIGVLADPDSVEALGGLLDDASALVYIAASRSLGEIARADVSQRGPVARQLLGAWLAAEGDRATSLRRDLTALAGVDYGERKEDWQRWAYGLP